MVGICVDGGGGLLMVAVDGGHTFAVGLVV